MTTVPDFFAPKLQIDGDKVSCRLKTWDADGHDVHIALGYTKTGDDARDIAAFNVFRMSLWQAVWRFAGSHAPHPPDLLNLIGHPDG